MEEYQITEAIPTVSEFLELRKSCGLSPRGVAASEVGLKNSWYSICVRRSCDRQLIGMGRIVGDGGTACQLVDIAVHPAQQQKGIGKQIMAQLLTYLERQVDPKAYVSLIADLPADQLYQQFGFVPTAPQSVGMYFKRRLSIDSQPD